MNLTIVTAVWERPEIFEMFADGVKLLQDHFKGRLNIQVCVSGSEHEVTKTMVESKGYFYVEKDNRFLGRKMNMAAILARKTEPDYCLLVGSDDIMGTDIMKHYYKEMHKGTDYVSVSDFYFFDTVAKKALYWAGYDTNLNRGHACGAGRMLSRRVMELLNYQPWCDDRLHNLLDQAFDRKIAPIKMTKVMLNLKELGCFGLDIKSSTNMTPFAQWHNTQYIDARVMLATNLPEDLAEKIYGQSLFLKCDKCKARAREQIMINHNDKPIKTYDLCEKHYKEFGVDGKIEKYLNKK